MRETGATEGRLSDASVSESGVEFILVGGLAAVAVAIGRRHCPLADRGQRVPKILTGSVPEILAGPV